MLPFVGLFPLFITLVAAAPQTVTSKDCVGTISSLNDVSAAVRCSTVNIKSFTVSAGKTFSLDLLQGAVVNVLGDVAFDVADWSGPLFQITGENITFNGHGKTWDGRGASYWDGRGTNGGTAKPHPMMSIWMSGTFSNVNVLNSPAHAISIGNGPIVVSQISIDNSQGNYPNAKSNGRPAGANTDGFDVCGDDVVIENSTVINQDDCLAVKRGRNIIFRDNYCEYGHGISIGSIPSQTAVDGVIIEGNTVVNSQQAFRIKTLRDATDSSVTNVMYSNNIARNCTEYGVIVTQSYPSAVGTPGSGVALSNISFSSGTTEVEVNCDAETIVLDCGDSCNGTWDWSDLKVGGGKLGSVANAPKVTGITL